MPDRVTFVAPSTGRTDSIARPSAGLASLPDLMFRAVINAVWFETDATRGAIHRLCRLTTCDLHVLAVASGERLVVSGECLCRDFLVDMLVEADGFLCARSVEVLRNPPGAVRVHVRKRSGEWTRRRRVDVGAQARTDRLRDSVIGRAMPDEYHRALLQFVAEEAGSLAPLGDDGALHRRLADLVAGEFGGTASDHLPRVASGLAVVEEICRAGRKVAAHPGSARLVTWWERYIDAPRGRRRRLDEVSLDAQRADCVGRRDACADEPDPDEAAVATVLRVVAGTPGAGLPTALQVATAELVRRDLLSAAEARRFVEDSRRMQLAAEQVRLLLVA